MIQNDSGPNQPTDDDQPNDCFADVEGYLDGELRDAVATVAVAARTGEADAEDLARFRRRLAQFDILVEDALEAEGEIDAEANPDLYTQDIARALWRRSIQGDTEGIRAEMARLDYHLETPE